MYIDLLYLYIGRFCFDSLGCLLNHPLGTQQSSPLTDLERDSRRELVRRHGVDDLKHHPQSSVLNVLIEGNLPQLHLGVVN